MVEKVIGGCSFRFIIQIALSRDASGNVIRLMPQSRYANTQNLPLHNYGGGPFCRFRIPNNLRLEGVYALCVDESIRYIGECLNLSARFNSGYGEISPRNCYRGGQPTNCRVNGLVLSSTDRSETLNLWFHPTVNRKTVERQLRVLLHPPWNAR
jgi:hypothetical protein